MKNTKVFKFTNCNSCKKTGFAKNGGICSKCNVNGYKKTRIDKKAKLKRKIKTTSRF